MSDFVTIGWLIFVGTMASIPPTIAALAAFRQTRIIHSLVNSQLDDVKEELAEAKSEIAELKRYIVAQGKS